jgi:hypothetical protein
MVLPTCSCDFDLAIKLAISFNRMTAEHIKMIEELESQGYLVVVLDKYQTAGLKRDDYGYVRHVMTERAESAIECITDREVRNEILHGDRN